MTIIVIGAGITGLSAAFELTERGVRCVVLEASDRVGGLILTKRVSGFTIEAGADSMLALKPAGAELCAALGLGPRLIATKRPRTVYVHARGRLHAVPSPSTLGIPATWRGLATYDLLPWSARIRLALDALRSRSGSGDESVASFFRRRFGPATVDLIAEPLLGGIHAGDIESLSMRSVAPRLLDAETRHGSVLRTIRQTRPMPGGEGLFKSLSAGMSELVIALDKRIPAGTIHLNTQAEAISRDEIGWRVLAGGREFHGNAVIVAAPAFAAERLLTDVAPDAARLCAEVPYVSTVSVALAWPRASVAHPLDGSGFVVARTQSTLRISACTWVSSKWDARAPADGVLLRAFLGGAADPAASDLSDDELVGIVRRDVGEVLGITDQPILSDVHRWPRAGAQHIVGHAARVARIEDLLGRTPGLFVAGSGFRAIGIPDCVADGRAAAAESARYVKMAG